MKMSLGPGTILLPTPTLVVGTYDDAGRPNVMTAAWGGICCSVPPCVSVSLRKATYTYGNLLAKQAFTISIPSRIFVREVDYFGIVSGRDTDKFAVSGLTAVRSDLVDAPYVEEFPVVLECNIVHVAELGLHTLFVGEILDVKVDDACLNEEGKVAAGLVRPFTWASPDNTYYALGDSLGRGFAVGKALEPKGS